MSNNLTLADAINEALDTGKEATFLYNGTLYTFSPAGILAFIEANIASIDFSGLPTADPATAGLLWSNSGVVTISAG